MVELCTILNAVLKDLNSKTPESLKSCGEILEEAQQYLLK